MVCVEQLEHGAAAEGDRDDGRAQQAAVAPGQDAAGDLRPGEAHLGAAEGSQGQGGALEGTLEVFDEIENNYVIKYSAKWKTVNL